MNKKTEQFNNTTKSVFGTRFLPDGNVEFKLFAPDALKVQLFIKEKNTDFKEVPLFEKTDDVYRFLTKDAKEGTLYSFKIDDNLLVPDPASNYQPYDVHGVSMLVDHNCFDWETDVDWKGQNWEEIILYELHTGTFSAEGTFKGIEKKLDYLKKLGVTAIELMPVADFPGKRNWGYDGVLIYAPDSSYGTPEDLKNLVKKAHEKGMSVFLDVVYNHFGPDGNYLYVYAKSKFFDTLNKTPWGDAINFKNRNVRDFFIENAIFWLKEYRLDGLRLDAIHAIKDFGTSHVLEELAARVKKEFEGQRKVHLVVENDDNEAKYLDITKNWQYSAQWNDDFHHCCHVLATGEEEGYYGDYASSKTSHSTAYFLSKVLAEGYAYQGELSPYRNYEVRGEKSSHLPPYKFVNFIQNHDQIGNRALGERLSVLSDKKTLKAIACLYLTAPSIPLLFMGEEWGSTTPFYFFCDFNEQLSEAVKNGRRMEFSRFKEFSTEEARRTIPDPSAENTFLSSRLEFPPEKSEMFDFYKKMLEIRKALIIPIIKKIVNSEYQIFNEKAFAVNWKINSEDTKELCVLANLGDEDISVEFDFSEYKIIAVSDEKQKDNIEKNRIISPKCVCWFLK